MTTWEDYILIREMSQSISAGRVDVLRETVHKHKKRIGRMLISDRDKADFDSPMCKALLSKNEEALEIMEGIGTIPGPSEICAAAKSGANDFLKKYCDPTTQEWMRWVTTPLHCAAENNQMETVKLLLSLGFSKDIRNKNGLAACQMSFYGMTLDVAEILIDDEGELIESCLESAVTNMNVPLAIEMFKRRPDSLPFHMLKNTKVPDFDGMIDALLEAGADPLKKDGGGNTAVQVLMMEAAKKERESREGEQKMFEFYARELEKKIFEQASPSGKVKQKARI